MFLNFTHSWLASYISIASERFEDVIDKIFFTNLYNIDPPHRNIYSICNLVLCIPER